MHKSTHWAIVKTTTTTKINKHNAVWDHIEHIDPLNLSYESIDEYFLCLRCECLPCGTFHHSNRRACLSLTRNIPKLVCSAQITGIYTSSAHLFADIRFIYAIFYFFHFLISRFLSFSVSSFQLSSLLLSHTLSLLFSREQTLLWFMTTTKKLYKNAIIDMDVNINIHK